MKNLTKLLITSSLLINSAAYATQAESKDNNILINFGGVNTNLNKFNGKGYNISAKVNFPLENNAFDFYVKASHQASKDEKKAKDFKLDETELAVGITYDISNEQLIFLEGGDIKQTFEQDDRNILKENLYVSRLGTKIKQGSYNFQIALEQRTGLNSATGYSTQVGFFNNSMRLSYTDVGEYQSLGLSFQRSF